MLAAVIAGLDSSFDRPTPEQAAAMFAAGVRVYGGYLPPGVGLASPWDLASFRVVQAAGMTAMGFASGNDDPVQVAATAEAWGVIGCLDDEPAIRGGSGWQQGWLDASGFGLYGLCPVHAGIRAAFHVVARYPGFDPGATWDPSCPDPGTPVGWQWQGTHTEFGLSVDRSWFDDSFQGGVMDPVLAAKLNTFLDAFPGATQAGQLAQIWNFLFYGGDGNVPGTPFVVAQLQAINASLAALSAGSLTPDLKAALDGIAAQVAALSKHLGAGTP